ncbi:LysR family transcriptional regulator [Alkalimarinus coralli]|uniref:LysR family transcriptional regulator n=1 Tax=Alkalimarinus coralli TaxID=2935863 RepID=UPI00202B35E9|nr:LysR family transcriptional regulator [Alkalimarinus coralli]
MDKLRVLQLFIAAAEQGSFAAVAKTLGTSPSTISKAISRLEADLGVQLLYRNTRHLKLTQSGESYALTVRNLVNELSTCETELLQSNDLPKGLLKVSVPVSYGRLYIRPWLKAFHQRYPDITLDISYSDHYVDIIEQGIDVCIRSGTVQDSRLVSRRLSPMDFIICASPEYLAQHGSPSGPEQFADHRWIRFRFGQTGKLMPIKFLKDGAIVDYEPDKSFVVDDGEALAELCADGMGLTQAPHFIARNWLNSTSIVPLYAPFQIDGYSVYALYPKRNYLPLRVRVFIDFLVEQLAKQGETREQTWASNLSLPTV